MQFANGTPTVEAESLPGEEEDLGNLTEHVIHRIVSHRRDSEGIMQLRIRWFGFDKNEDTWEPLLHIPAELVRRYIKRKRLDRKDFLSLPLQAVDDRTTVEL
jgi:Chromo (CHRromatin Organisation MOdifier) domain